jgi:hypothetical protein
MAVAWLAPLLVGEAMAPRRPLERARLSWWLVLFAAMTIVTYDALNRNSGIGFLYVRYD